MKQDEVGTSDAGITVNYTYLVGNAASLSFQHSYPMSRAIVFETSEFFEILSTISTYSDVQPNRMLYFVYQSQNYIHTSELASLQMIIYYFL